VFLGTYTPKLDDKGRLTLPAKFRDELRGGLMITKGQDHCLYVFTRETFEEMARKVASAPLTSESTRAFQRNLFSGTDEQNPDAQGRIAIILGRRCLAALPGRARRRLRESAGGGPARPPLEGVGHGAPSGRHRPCPHPDAVRQTRRP
jgi:division/cell wall cluster transcriptional repressor MraZ